MISLRTVVHIVAGLGAVSANPAADAVATASLDWSNFQVFALGVPGQPAPTFSLSSQSTTWGTSAFTVNDSSDNHTHVAFNWTTALDIASNTPHANGDANASGSQFATSASASESSGGNLFLQNQAAASLQRSAFVSLSGPAAVIFSVPYSISEDALQNDPSRRATASVSGDATFTPTGGFAQASTSRSFSLDSIFNGPGSQNGLLFFGLVVDGAGLVTANFSASTSAFAPDPVPEPSVVLALVAGLVVLAAVAKRRTT